MTTRPLSSFERVPIIQVPSPIPGTLPRAPGHSSRLAWWGAQEVTKGVSAMLMPLGFLSQNIHQTRNDGRQILENCWPEDRYVDTAIFVHNDISHTSNLGPRN